MLLFVLHPDFRRPEVTHFKHCPCFPDLRYGSFLCSHRHLPVFCLLPRAFPDLETRSRFPESFQRPPRPLLLGPRRVGGLRSRWTGQSQYLLMRHYLSRHPARFDFQWANLPTSLLPWPSSLYPLRPWRYRGLRHLGVATSCLSFIFHLLAHPASS